MSIDKYKRDSFIVFSVVFIVSATLLFFAYKTNNSTQQPTIDTPKTDSMQVFYSKQLDSIKVENQLLQVKIEAKTETIRTLKGLVKENNHYFESITDSALFEELKKVRSGGIR